MGLFVQETFENKSEGYLMNEGEVYESFTDNLKDLFRSMQDEYGRCISTCFIDIRGKSKKIGWVFEKKMRYEDTGEHYIQHTWINIHEKEPETETVVYYKYL